MNKFFLLGFLIFTALGCAKTQEQQPDENSNKSFKLNIKVDDNAESFTAIQSTLPGKNILATGSALGSTLLIFIIVYIMQRESFCRQ